MMAWLSRLIRSFRCALRGLTCVVFTQQNARIHALAVVMVVVFGFWLRITRTEWCLVALACGLVLAAESMNSAMEKLADRVTMEKDERIRDAKDAGAGATLIASIAATVIGVIVFAPRLMAMLGW